MASPRTFRLIATRVSVAIVVGAGVWVAFRAKHPGRNSSESTSSSRGSTTAQTAYSRTSQSEAREAASPAISESEPHNSNGPFTDAELAAEAKRRVSRSGAEALAWAQAQSDPAQLERFVLAVLHAWGGQDPKAAIDWLLQHDDTKETTWHAVFAGAAQQPLLLVDLVRGLIAVAPKKYETQGSVLLDTLASVGQHAAAAEFAQTAPPELREDWIKAAFRRWSADKPEDAALALAALGSDPAHAIAFPALVAGWTEKNPAGLAAYALTLPNGDDRGYALGQAMLKWCEQDPTALASWLTNVKSRPEYDLGAMLLVTQTDRANRSTDLALRWTESINDPTLKRESLQSVVAEWLQTDPLAATAYVERVTWLSPEEKAKLVQTAAATATDEP